MKESEFIANNKNNWVEAEKILKKDKPEPEKMYKIFVNVSDNLSYARTKYGNRQVRVYLNDLSQSLFVFLYKNRSGNKKTIFDFWTKKLPLTIFRCRRELFVSFIIFSLAIAIGVFSAFNDPQFARDILGDNYINMTLDNIEKGDPMGVYKDANSGAMFLGITINNIMVSFRVFIMGIFAGVGSAIMLIYNGIMLGTFQYFFIERGLTWISFITIWQHGIIEISSIVIAGGAGIVLGKGLLFPGSYSRSVSLRKSASRAVTIVIGLIPLFILAGFIESYITRQTELPDYIKILSLLMSASLIIGYFYIYPRKVGKMRDAKEETIEEIASIDKPVDLKKTYSTTQIFNNTLRFYKMNFESIISLSFFLAIAYGVYGIILYFTGSTSIDPYNIFKISNHDSSPIFILFSIIVFTVFYSRIYFLITKNSDFNFHPEKSFRVFFRKHWFILLLYCTLMYFPMLMVSNWKYVISIIVFVLFHPTVLIILNNKSPISESLTKGLTIAFSYFGRFISPILIFVILIFAAMGGILSISAFLKTVTDWGLEGLSEFAPAGMIFFNLFWSEFFGLIISALFFISLTFVWFSVYEIDNAGDLIRRVENIANTKKFKFDK